MTFQDIFAAFIILYFACCIPQIAAAFLDSRFFYFQRRMSERSFLSLSLRGPRFAHRPFSKIRLFCLERPHGFSGLAPRPLLQLHSQQETCQLTGQRSGVGLLVGFRPGNASKCWGSRETLLDDRRPGMRLCAYPGPLQIETPFAIPDTTQASFRDDDFAHADLTSTCLSVCACHCRASQDDQLGPVFQY